MARVMRTTHPDYARRRRLMAEAEAEWLVPPCCGSTTGQTPAQAHSEACNCERCRLGTHNPGCPCHLCAGRQQLTVNANPGRWVLSLVIGGALLYAGYRRGVKIEERDSDSPIFWPTVGWSLLGPIGPGYLVGRLSAD